jgi:hypothetical protein
MRLCAILEIKQDYVKIVDLAMAIDLFFLHTLHIGVASSPKTREVNVDDQNGQQTILTF